jgi:lipopolysaccharide/colanic/teichoic acid biosynthesis glycosyltransferase
MWKFRSMCADAEIRRKDIEHLNDHGDDHVLFKMRDDPRITRVGRVLRRTSLDELPQLVNILRGEMSLVGPRPPLPTEVERYVGSGVRRLLVRPGLTGLWQVSGRSELSWEESLRLDLHYVENWSLFFDLHILWRTAFAVLRRSGAY